MTNRDRFDAGVPHAPETARLWGEGISDDVDTHLTAADPHSGAYVADNDVRVPPTPVGQDDGRILVVDSDALIYGDAAAGGAAISPHWPLIKKGLRITPDVGFATITLGEPMTSFGTDLGRMWAGPVMVPGGMLVDRFLFSIPTAGPAGSLVRAGIYLPDADMRPRDLLIDLGTVAADTTGAKQFVIDPLLELRASDGLVYAVLVPQGVAPDTLRFEVADGPRNFVPGPFGSTGLGSQYLSRNTGFSSSGTSHTGPLPATFGNYQQNTSPRAVFVQLGKAS